LRVVCVRVGDRYGDVWVKNLWRMVARHLPIPHEFVCITEKPIGGLKCIPPLCEYQGWWQKLGLFKPGALPGDNLYLDLDVVIRDSLLPLVALLYKSPGLWARDDFSYSMRSPKRGLDEAALRMLGGPGCVNSSVMLWRGDVAKDVWEKHTAQMLKDCHGDQNVLSKILGSRINFIPDELVSSFKYSRHLGQPDGNVVVFHGNPKPDELPERHPLRLEWAS
jgi:hypothetical protein